MTEEESSTAGEQTLDHMNPPLGTRAKARAHGLKSLPRLTMCVERLKLPRLGKTCSTALTPNHSAMGTTMLSQGYLGMIRPRPASYSPPSVSASGKSLKTCPPFMSPPMMRWLPPQPWSVPLPLLMVSVRPKSEAVAKTVDSKTPCAFNSATKSPRAEFNTFIKFPNLNCMARWVSKPSILTKKKSRSVRRRPRVEINRATWCSSCARKVSVSYVVFSFASSM
mmetsp:Transcript_90038/g.250093  ORF Transcript_90038/g.250093 Transcript_90038/m.250093 type:complete len:223 (-) Transcript_90038:2039-2707(-)